ncbi:hypothetical protein SK128_012341 [Halocaridina rubra]|uniref:Uncharacterized protein n=1 Tax=Halocaridina rubra TaxID=373956 RepID=A0AAN9A064_HALRR
MDSFDWVFADTFIYAIRLKDIRKALLQMYGVFRNRVHNPTEHRRVSNTNSSTRTVVSRLSLSSPWPHR